MTVRELREVLGSVDGRLQVVLAKDHEGNSFSPLTETEIGIYTAESLYSGSFVTEGSFDDWPNGQPWRDNALCLWPTN